MGERQAQAAVEHDPERRRRFQSLQAHVEARVVGERGAAADQHRVVAGAQEMGAPARRLAGDPAALAALGRDAPVERGGELQRDQRPAPAPAQQIAGVHLGRRFGVEAERNPDPGVAQAGQPGAGDARVRVLQRHDATGDAGGDQRIGAGRGRAVVRAGLEGDVSAGAARTRAGAGERLGLGVRPAARLGPAARDDAAGADDHAADRGIGRDPAQAALGEHQRGAHVLPIGPITRDRRAFR